MPTAPTKTCSKCREALPLSAFGSNRSKRDGLQNYCRECTRIVGRESMRKVRATPAGRARSRASGREASRKLCATPEGRERRNATARASARKVRSTPEGRERHIATTLVWQSSNPERAAANGRNSGQRRRARLRQVESSLTSAEWRTVLDAFAHRCAYCGTDGPLDQDHVIPVVKGGAHVISNVVPSCAPCNRGVGGKHALDLDDWLARPFPRPRVTAAELVERMSSYLNELAVSA